MAHQLQLNTEKLEELKVKAEALPAEKKLEPEVELPLDFSWMLENVFTPNVGYDGMAKVRVRKDADLVPENIAKGVTIFGVEGMVAPFSLDVVTAASLPETVVDGQIIVITETAAENIYVSTDKPDNPAMGDIWIEVAADADVILNLTDQSPYLENGLCSANQYTGSGWQTLDGYADSAGTWAQFSSLLPLVGTSLNDMSWEDIARVAAAGKASEYFSIGDVKHIQLNGNINDFNDQLVGYSAWAFIIGFDHNAELEGKNRIHFQLFKSAETGGKNLAFIDSKGEYATYPNATNYFVMNFEHSTRNGWNACNVRQNKLGNKSTPASPPARTIMSVLPADLRAVMKATTKYTDNVGNGSNSASSVTPTTDYLWLLSEYELFGVRTYANVYEAEKQQQYAYYAAGNSTVFYRHTATSSTARLWLRSPYATNTAQFCCTSSSGTASTAQAGYSFGLAPCFCV